MNPHRIFFFDWDGTLSIGNRPVSDADRSALKSLQRQGHRLFLCTGRARGYLLPEALEFGFDGIIAGAGTHIVAGERELLCETIPPSILRPLVSLFLESGQGCILESAAGMVLIHMGNAYASFHLPVIEKIEDFDALSRQYPINKFSLFGERRPGVEEALDAYLTLIPNDGYAEVLPKGCCKSAGMRLVLEDAGLTREDSVAFGDSTNDTDMLIYAGIGVAMGNAPDEVKAAADFVTGTCEESGVAGALHNLGFLPSDEEHEHFINK